MNIMKQQEATLVQRACAKVTGFKDLHKRLEKKIIVSGKSYEYTQQLHAMHRSCVSAFQLPAFSTGHRANRRVFASW